jgi:hypothetical protein
MGVAYSAGNAVFMGEPWQMAPVSLRAIAD